MLEMSEWTRDRKLCEALHHYDFSEVEIVTVYLNHEYERSLTTE